MLGYNLGGLDCEFRTGVVNLSAGRQKVPHLLRQHRRLLIRQRSVRLALLPRSERRHYEFTDWERKATN